MILAVATRLILINQPYVDHWSWRQSDVAAIAANFLQNGFRFGFPQIDWAGNAPGYVGTEFPILPFLAALCYKVAGVHEWVGRIQAVIFFAVSLPFFFLLVRETFDRTAAVWATFFYSFAPVSVFAGRSFMPDVPSLSLAIVGLYFFLRWTNDHNRMQFSFAAIAISFSLLIKITSMVIVGPLLYLTVAAVGVGRNVPTLERPAVDARGTRSFRRNRPAAVCHLVLARVSSRTQILSASLLRRRRDSNREFLVVLAHRARDSDIQPHAGSLTNGADRFVRPAVAGSKMLSPFSLVAGCDGPLHHRGRLRQPAPLVPTSPRTDCRRVRRCRLRVYRIKSFLACYCGRRCRSCWSSSFTISAFWYLQPFYQSSAAQLRDAGLELNKVTPPDALIVAADMGDPTIFYYAQRKGWHFLEKDAIYNGNPDDSQQAINDLERLRRRGATHFVFTRNTFWWLQSYPEFARYLAQNAMLVEATPEFKIYRLEIVAR